MSCSHHRPLRSAWQTLVEAIVPTRQLPYLFYPHDSPAGRQLLEQAGQDGSRLQW
jgi:hypothetical protein